MNTLLLFFALPIATIILSIVLLKILRCPILVSATFFAIYLILTYSVFNTDFLIFAISYTILSYITALITKTICNVAEKINSCIDNRIPNLRNIRECICNNIEKENENRSNNTQARFTVTTNQTDPVLFLGNRNNICNRSNCCCKRR